MNDYQELTTRFLNRECSPEEARRLLAYFRSKPGDADMVKLIEATLEQVPSYDDGWDDDLSVQRNRIRIMDAVALSRPGVRKVNWLVAASILFILSIGTSIYLYRHYNPPSDILTGQLGTAGLPGGNRASLILDDGRTIALSEAQSGIVVDEEIRYLDGSEVMDLLVPQHITLSTPTGGTYQVTLSDGTRVWLNAASEISYPSRFDRTERVVKLSGEAYFEVEPSPSNTDVPFKVVTDGQVVEVLGTRFNITAYSDESEVKTTLVEGSVEVSTPHTRMRLEPDQQSILKNGILTYREAYATEEFAWVKGEFHFNDESLASIMRTLARWYGVEIKFANERLKTEVFFGVVSRSDHITQVLDHLAQVGDVRFHIEGNVVHVHEKK